MHPSWSCSSSCLLLALTLAACGGSSADVGNANAAPTEADAGDAAAPRAPDPKDAGVDAAPVDAGVDGATPTSCNTLVNDGTDVGIEMVATNAPAATGGTIADGKYHLTSVVLYSGPGGTAGPLPATIKSTVLVHGGFVDIIQSTGTKVDRLTQAISATGTVVTWTQTCPKGSKATSTGYSATPTSLTTFIPNDKGQLVGFTYGP